MKINNSFLSFTAITLLLLPLSLLGNSTEDYQKELSNFKPEERLNRLKSDLNPSEKISMKGVTNWNREKQFKKCLQDEGQYISIENQIIEPLQASWKNNIENKSIFTKRASLSLPVNKSFKTIRTFENIDIQRYHSEKSTSKNQLLTNYKKIEDLEIVGTDYKIDNQWRDSSDLMSSKLIVNLRYDIRGINKNGQRQNDRGFIDAHIVKKNNDWKIEKLNFKSGDRVIAKRQPAFQNKTKHTGLSKVNINERSEAIRRGGYALSINDINGDGYLDIFSGSAKDSQVFWGTADGKWIPSKTSELTRLKAVKTAVFNDFDNDGDLDALMTLFEYDRDDSDLAYMENHGNGNFKAVKGFLKGKLQYNLPMPASVADFNKDGHLDLYVGFPGKRDFTIIDDDSNKANYPQGLFLNLMKDKSKKRFVDVTKKSWSKSGLDQINSLFPHSSMAVDYDRDGDMDLLVIDDRSNLSPFYENNNGRLTPINNKINIHNKSYGMGVALGDLNNDGAMEIAMTNVNFHARDRFHQACFNHWYFEYGKHPGLRLFKGNQSHNKVTYSDVSNSTGLDWMAEGAAGVEFIDYNNDGLMDIYVSSGLWSGEKREKDYDISSLFARAIADKKTYDDVLSPYREYRKKDWSFISILRDDKRETTLSMAGYQRNRLYLNTGDMNFVEVGYLEGVDSIADGYIIALSDANNDGKVDLLLRNGDPGTMKYQFPTIEYFQNSLEQNNNYLSLFLTGTKSNKDAIGTIVNLELNDGTKMTRQLISNNGAAQSQLFLHFGLANHQSAKNIEVIWPSGTTQSIEKLNKGSYRLIEGQSPRLLKFEQNHYFLSKTK